MKRWKCRKCWYVYDPRVGDPDGGIPPGTPFEQIPDDWVCPVCGARKSDFYVVQAPPPPEPTNQLVEKERPARDARSERAAPPPAQAPPPAAPAAASPPAQRPPAPPVVAPPRPASPAPAPLAPPQASPPSASPTAAPMWTVGSLKGWRQGHDKA